MHCPIKIIDDMPNINNCIIVTLNIYLAMKNWLFFKSKADKVRCLSRKDFNNKKKILTGLVVTNSIY